MKKRIGYVSNSSSSSFVVIDDECRLNPIKLSEWRLMDELNSCSQDGFCQFKSSSERCFGRQEEKYYTFGAKWNWLVMQACYCAMNDGDKSYERILDDFVKRLGQEGVDWSLIEKAILDVDAFIDHQSIDPKGTFDKVLEYGIGEFLMDDRCFVQNDDDED